MLDYNSGSSSTLILDFKLFNGVSHPNLNFTFMVPTVGAALVNAVDSYVCRTRSIQFFAQFIYSLRCTRHSWMSV